MHHCQSFPHQRHTERVFTRVSVTSIVTREYVITAELNPQPGGLRTGQTAHDSRWQLKRALSFTIIRYHSLSFAIIHFEPAQISHVSLYFFPFDLAHDSSLSCAV